MSGAEAAGLAVGVIALASLFNTCLELFEYIEAGRDFLYDFDLACTKICALHRRLQIWGSVVRLSNQGYEHCALQDDTGRTAIDACLRELDTVLRRTEKLKKRYEVNAIVSCQTHVDTGRIAAWSANLRRRTTWSIRDKARLEKFIGDIKFLVGNLEKIANPYCGAVNMSKKHRQCQQKTTEFVVEELELVDEVEKTELIGRLTTAPDVRASKTQRSSGIQRLLEKGALSSPDFEALSALASSRVMAPAHDKQHIPFLKAQDVPPKVHRIEGNQTISGGSIGLKAVVGTVEGVIDMTGDQAITDFSCGFMGAGNENLILKMQQQAAMLKMKAKD
ncbi:hypothetical protein KC345_g3274 [Hortaea werneckii]|nr:hypothetical protein KC345_g3274 [Hortaea werneckii]